MAGSHPRVQPTCDACCSPYARGVSLTTALEQQLGVLARRLSKPVRLHGPSGWTVMDRPAFQAMWRIAEEGPLRVTALAALLEVDLSVASRQVRSLVDAGLVQREPDPSDARAVLVSVTESGREAYASTAQRRSEVLSEVLSGWSAADRNAFVSLLSRFNVELEASIARRLESPDD